MNARALFTTYSSIQIEVINMFLIECLAVKCLTQPWGSQPLDFNQEPRKVFVNYLIWTAKIIETKLFMTGEACSVIRLLKGLITKLDRKSQQTLKPQLAKLVDFEDDVYSLTLEDLDRIFSEVMAFLHETYLKESYYATPKYKATKLEVPHE